MKFQEHKPAGENQFSSSDDGVLIINGEAHRKSLWMSPSALHLNWPIEKVHDVTFESLRDLIALKPEVILLGSGAKFAFPPLDVMRAVKSAGVALDVMDTKACCRTYNILASEGRHIVAAVILDGAQ